MYEYECGSLQSAQEGGSLERGAVSYYDNSRSSSSRRHLVPIPGAFRLDVRCCLAAITIVWSRSF